MPNVSCFECLMKFRYTLPLGLAAALLPAASRIEVGRSPEQTFGAVTTIEPGPRTYTGQAESPSVRPDTLYRWRGADGQIHVQSQPPPRGIRAEVFRLTREDASGEDSAGRKPTAAPANSASGIAADPLSVYSPRGFTELKERLGSIVTRLNERARLLEDLQRAR
ncbi:MAG: DUF4124 domain-containing protein [Gammaproteobacteria bacterium]